ncbi:hypothetical protein QR680_012722 [Steinernema hermaphroditum]|uniref:Uncharacterized protein n=1 Tax=Steinernema hermaphroditum TaxID=289476 RepID=A0AA39I5I4_9BILA|nr:hypothetical protein QR680_012722 [Steinernema hermaphroditum]
MSASSLLACVAATLVGVAVTTPSIFSCPLNTNFIGGLPGINGVGEICGTGSFLHYWTCCEDNPFRCCFEFETWAIVLFSVVLVMLIGAILFAIGRYVADRY